MAGESEIKEIAAAIDELARAEAINSLRDAMQPLRDLLTANRLQDLAMPVPRASLSITHTLDLIRDIVLKNLADAVWEGELSKVLQCARAKK